MNMCRVFHPNQRTVNALDLNLKAAFRHYPSNEEDQEAHTPVVAVLLAYEYRTKTSASPLDEDLALDVLRAFPYILATATTTERRRLAAMTVDGSLYLLRSALECLELSDEVTTSTRRAIEARPRQLNTGSTSGFAANVWLTPIRRSVRTWTVCLPISCQRVSRF